MTHIVNTSLRQQVRISRSSYESCKAIIVKLDSKTPSNDPGLCGAHFRALCKWPLFWNQMKYKPWNQNLCNFWYCSEWLRQKSAWKSFRA